MTGPIRIAISSAKDQVYLRTAGNGASETRFSFTATELDELIAALSDARAQLAQLVSFEPSAGPNRKEAFEINPAWKITGSPHESVLGVLLRIRHPGFGWLRFMIPFEEARALGHWLFKLTPVPQVTDAPPDPPAPVTRVAHGKRKRT